MDSFFLGGRGRGRGTTRASTDESFSQETCGFKQPHFLCYIGHDRDTKIKTDTQIVNVKSESKLILKPKRTTTFDHKILTAGFVTNTSIRSVDSSYSYNSLTCQFIDLSTPHHTSV